MKSTLSLLLLALALPAAPVRAATPPVVAPMVPHASVVVANARRSYPPSCLSSPLPSASRGPAVTRTITLADLTGNYTENVAVTMWRAACSGRQGPLGHEAQAASFGVDCAGKQLAAAAPETRVPLYLELGAHAALLCRIVGLLLVLQRAAEGGGGLIDLDLGRAAPGPALTGPLAALIAARQHQEAADSRE